MSTTPQAPAADLLAAMAKPSRAYQLRSWLAVVALVLFLVLYLALAGWFLFTAYRLTFGAAAPGDGPFWGYVAAGCALFLGVFMLKALFFVRRGSVGNAIEVTAADQPRLFEFLHEIAAKAGAPRPHKVFLSPHVNACVFYDLSIVNLLIPSRKNLEIGLGLVNSLTLGEFRAVLAHEFGHFAQRAMAVSRWIYTAQQIAGHLVAQRDKFDDFLVGLSHVDLRIAWVGWVLRLIVWSIRSLVETLFTGVLLIQRSLSREMEFHADLVAVSLTGSDALVHALYKLQAADDAWGRTLDFAFAQKGRGKLAKDVFALHTEIVRRMGTILNEPGYGQVATVPAERPEAHRLFKAELAQPPRMWLTHPLNHEREENAKRLYVPAQIDDRSAWELFTNAEALRERSSAELLGPADNAVASQEEPLAALEAQFGREHLKARYRGIYLNRSIVRHVARPGELHAGDGTSSDLGQIYPESLTADMDTLRVLERERGQLQAVKAGVLSVQGDAVQHRGRRLKMNDLPAAIAQVDKDIAEVEGRLHAHDRLCRAAHLQAARDLGDGWAEYLAGVIAVHHYADHAEANLRDAQGTLATIVNVETVTRKVSDAGIKRVVAAAQELFQQLEALYAQAADVKLDANLAERFGAASWSEALGALTLVAPVRDNIGDWLQACDGWVNHAAGLCGGLRTSSLEHLLATEASIAVFARHRAEVKPALAPSSVPAQYQTLLPGAERKRPSGLGWWAKFQTADGKAAAVARFAVAGCIAAAVLGFGALAGQATVSLHNGLARPVAIQFGDRKVQLGAFASTSLDLDGDRVYPVLARTLKGETIEQFDADVRGAHGNYVYNVAGASPLVEWTVVYGNGPAVPERYLGNRRWGTTTAEVRFTEPPKSVSSKYGGATRDVIEGYGKVAPGTAIDLLKSEQEQFALIASHARWDASDAPNTVTWLAAATRLPSFAAIIAARLKEAPEDIVVLRAEQDGAQGAEKQGVCARHRAAAAAAPAAPDWAYLAARCVDDVAARNALFKNGREQWPQHGWFAFAAGYTDAEWGRWKEALAAYEVALRKVPGLQERLALDTARMLRATEEGTAARMESLESVSPRLRDYRLVESGGSTENPEVKTYAALFRGNLTEALQLAKQRPESEPRLVRLAAASDGAEPALVSRALALPAGKGHDMWTLGAAVGLALREKRDATPYLEVLAQARPEQRDAMRRFVMAMQHGATPDTASPLLDGIEPELRAQGYAIGVILWGDKAPPSWRHDAKALLFMPERPYFK